MAEAPSCSSFYRLKPSVPRTEREWKQRPGISIVNSANQYSNKWELGDSDGPIRAICAHSTPKEMDKVE
jgi:hypothetical protein